MCIDSEEKAPKKPQARSRITNGTKLGPEIDGRSLWARRLRDVIAIYAADMGGSVSTSQMSLVRRAAVMTVELELLESTFAAGGSASLDSLDRYQRIGSGLRRLLGALGLLSGHVQEANVVEASRTLDNVRLVRRPAGTTDPLLNGPDVEQRATRLDLARRLFHVIRKALKDGSELPPNLAEFAMQLLQNPRLAQAFGMQEGWTLEVAPSRREPESVTHPRYPGAHPILTGQAA